MTVYRINLQFKYPYSENPSGFYYCSATHYASVSNLTQLDVAIDTVMAAERRAHNNSVEMDWQNIIDTSDGSVFQNGPFVWPPGTLQPGFPAGLLNTVYVGFLANGVLAGYKRVRAPLRVEDMDADRLSPVAQAFYESNYANYILSSGYACNVHGTIFTGAYVRTKISGWQLRHGTKRRQVRRYHA